MENDITLLVVESDQPTQVRMFNGLGCDIGCWEYADWVRQIARGDIVVQDGDKFVMEAAD